MRLLIFIFPLFFISKVANGQIQTGNPNDSIVGCISGEISYGVRPHTGGLVFDLAIGSSLLRNTLSPSIKVGLGVGYDEQSIIVSYETFYFFEKNNSDQFSKYGYSFLGVTYLHSNAADSSKGIGLSYLIKDTESHFIKSTFMLSYFKEVKGWQIIPSVIISNNGKSFFPMFGVNYSLFK
jgi:hypothetical protein